MINSSKWHKNCHFLT